MLEIVIIVIVIIFFIWSSERFRKLEEKIDKSNLHFQEIECKLNQLDEKLDNK